MTCSKYLYVLVVNINSLTNYIYQHPLQRVGYSISHPYRFRNWYFIITYLCETVNCATSDTFKQDGVCDDVRISFCFSFTSRKWQLLFMSGFKLFAMIRIESESQKRFLFLLIYLFVICS